MKFVGIEKQLFEELVRKFASNGNILPFFACPGKTKNPDSVKNQDFKVLKVVPPGIEPGTQGFSVLCSTN